MDELVTLRGGNSPPILYTLFSYYSLMSTTSAAAMRLNLNINDIIDITETELDGLDGLSVTEIVEMIHVPWEDPAD